MYQRATSVVLRRVAGEVLLVPVAGALADLQRVFALDEVGAAIWEHLDGPRTVAQIRDALLDRFEVAADELERDLGQFLEELRSAELILPAETG